MKKEGFGLTFNCFNFDENFLSLVVKNKYTLHNHKFYIVSKLSKSPTIKSISSL